MIVKNNTYRHFFLLALFLLGLQPVRAQLDVPSSNEWEDIKEQALALVDYYSQLLNYISIEDLPETQRRKLIANAYDPDFPRAGFLNEGVNIEYDLTPSGFARGSGIYQEVADYLKAFTLLYRTEGQMNTVQTQYLGCRIFNQDYLGVEVVFDLSLGGKNKRGESFGTTRKVMETIAKREGIHWRVYIKGITHFTGSLAPYACESALELDSDTDGVPDSVDECPYEFGYRTISGCPDDDLDGVPNKHDPCPKVEGPKTSEGCPDSDNDGLADHLDKCPYASGPPEFGGCPDSDGDGVLDEKDRCRFAPGLAELNGCPDRDEDGVPDIDDKCPDEHGIYLYRGCPEPDMDADGVVDSMDECISVPGPVRFKGCPDQDGDGVPDKDDRCVDVKGPSRYKGCPDSDGDGIPDLDDPCPELKGKLENDGCPWWLGRKGFLENTYAGINYQLVNRPAARYRSISVGNFGRRWENFSSKTKKDLRFESLENYGIAVYAPLGGYFFGYSNSETIPLHTYTVGQLFQLYDQLEGKGIDVLKPEFYDYEFSGRIYHAGLCVGPFFQVKYLRHLFFTAGLSFVDGDVWEEYKADFQGGLPPSYGDDIFVVNRQNYDRETWLETGVALVFPFVQTEFTYFSYMKTWSWKVGVNVPLSMVLKKQ